jgi:hypothetical protein
MPFPFRRSATVNQRLIPRLALVTSALGALAYACGGGDTGEIKGGLTGGAAATSGTGPIVTTGGATGSGSGGTTGSGSGGSGVVVTGGTTGTGATGGSGVIDEDAACGTGSANASLKPVNMLVMFDRSGSMLDCSDGTPRQQSQLCPTASRWDTASAALKAFFADPGAADLGVALRFFPHDLPAAGCTGGNNGACDANACSPVRVDMGTLTSAAAPADAQEAALIAAVDASGPPAPGGGMMSGGTPIHAALSG